MLTQERLKELLHYDPETGAFTWILPRMGVRLGHAGTCRHDGYVQIKVDGSLYLSHRLAWLYMTGEWPKDQIDHINRVRGDNRWQNLREATNAQNAANSSVLGGNSSGAKGVVWHKRGKKWQARIRHARKKLHLGMYDTVSQAKSAYDLAAYLYKGEFARA